MSDNRIQKLESIGFQWSLSWDAETDPWTARFLELKKYKKKHGHCNAPRRYGPLGRWIGKQRQYYRLLEEGKSSHMSDDHIQKLESIDFQWSLKYRLPIQLNNGGINQWDARFQELKKYKGKHGDCNVPRKHGWLGSWVQSQRRSYRWVKEGKSSSMSDDRIQKLESIGFQWSCSRRRDSDAIMQSTTNNTPSDEKSGKYKDNLKKCSVLHMHCLRGPYNNSRYFHAMDFLQDTIIR